MVSPDDNDMQLYEEAAVMLGEPCTHIKASQQHLHLRFHQFLVCFLWPEGFAPVVIRGGESFPGGTAGRLHNDSAVAARIAAVPPVSFTERRWHKPADQ